MVVVTAMVAAMMTMIMKVIMTVVVVVKMKIWKIIFEDGRLMVLTLGHIQQQVL
jgi:hypothetical protein